MLVGANGLTTVAEEHLTSSLTSLISALSPIFIFLASMAIGLEKFTFRTACGLLVGFLGVIFIFWDGFHDLLNPGYRLGILTLIIAVMSWGLGTIYIKKLQIENRNLFLNLFYQFAFAGIIQLAFAFSSAKTIDVSTWSLESIAAILYLAIFGSVVAFFSYHYLLKTLLPTQVSMLSYVNTVISIVLSWLILNETISAKFIIAAVFIISGVFIINYKSGILKKRMRKREI